MEIISHRGYWLTDEEKNSVAAFERSFSKGFGTETDFRDFNSKIVIAHDMATADNLSADAFFEIYKSYDIPGTLALNIKADGLQKPLRKLLKKYEIKNYFAFDMSIPDTLGYLREELPFLSRQSEYEPQAALYEHCKGIWLDCFKGIWFDADLVKKHLANNKSVTFVSPELHKREHLSFWDLLKSSGLHKQEKLILCTDLPEEAAAFFG